MLSDLPETLPSQVPELRFKPRPGDRRTRASFATPHCPLLAPSSGLLCRRDEIEGKEWPSWSGNQCSSSRLLNIFHSISYPQVLILEFQINFREFVNVCQCQSQKFLLGFRLGLHWICRSFQLWGTNHGTQIYYSIYLGLHFFSFSSVLQFSP